jgi:hypothetical protein
MSASNRCRSFSLHKVLPAVIVRGCVAFVVPVIEPIIGRAGRVRGVGYGQIEERRRWHVVHGGVDDVFIVRRVAAVPFRGCHRARMAMRVARPVRPVFLRAEPEDGTI